MKQSQKGPFESSSTGTSQLPALMSTDRFWLWLFVGYFLLHVGLRLATGGALGLDEAEILLDARTLEWGYGPQLPLYAWLQWAVFQVSGPGILGLSILKNGLLLATVIIFYLILRTRQAPLMSGLAVLSLLMLYQFSWEAQRALTHTALANFCAVLTFAVLWQLIRKPTTWGFVLFGLVVALGGLSKYNYAVALVAMLLAGFSDPVTRKPLCSPRMLASVGIATVLLMLPLHWIQHNPEEALASARKLNMSSEGLTLVVALQGLAELAVAALGFVSLLLIVLGALWLTCRKQGTVVAADDLTKLMFRIVFWALVLMALAVLTSGSTNIKDRWLQPILIFAGPALVLWLLPRTGAIGTRRFVQISAGLAGLIAVAMLHHNLAGDAKRAAPFAELTRQIVDQTPPGSAIVAHNWLAGNMAYFAPEQSIYMERGTPPEGPILRVWETEERNPKDIDPERIVTLAKPYRFDDGEVMSLSFAPVKD